jgi:fibronectin-binding autotransporter adhesin
MKRFKRVLSGTSAAVLSLSSLLTMGFTGVAHAATQTCLWQQTGATYTDNKFSTVSNWSNCGGGTPQTGDIILLRTANYNGSWIVEESIDNDINIALGGVRLESSNSGVSTQLYINSLRLANGAIVTDAQAPTDIGRTTLTVGSATSTATTVADGDVTLVGQGYLSLYTKWNITGKLILSSGVKAATGASSVPGGIVLQNGASLILDPGADIAPTYSAPITLGGGTGTTRPVLGFDAVCNNGGRSCAYASTTWSVTSPITLLSDAYIYPGQESTVDVKGAVTGSGFKLEVDPAAYGVLTINPTSNNSATQTGTQTQQVVTTSYSDTSITQSIDVRKNNIAIVDGTYGTTHVDASGILKGTGTVLDLYVSSGGIIAPGHSPGCLKASTINLAGEYQFELGGNDPCTSYDQIQVTSPSVDPSVTIDDTSATLTAIKYGTFAPAKGKVFVIIDNQGDKAVKGTFKALPEGATFTQDGILFKISYVGGTGNDVTLTVMGGVGVPDTGFALISSNPLLTLGATAGAAIVLVGMARKTRPAHARAHAARRRK